MAFAFGPGGPPASSSPVGVSVGVSVAGSVGVSVGVSVAVGVGVGVGDGLGGGGGSSATVRVIVVPRSTTPAGWDWPMTVPGAASAVCWVSMR